MKMSKNQIILILVVIALLVLGYYFKKNNSTAENKVADQSVSTTTNVVSLNANGASGYKVEQVPINPTGATKNIPMPDLERPIVFDKNQVFSEEIKNLYTSKILGLKEQIKKNPNSLLPWLDLGMYEKAIGDYEGAKISWKYVSERAPTDFVSLGNLGNLYAYYLKDNAMAETYYKQAISKSPKQTYLYIQLAEVYRDVYKDNEKAKAIIDQGLKIMPGEVSLLDFRKNL